MSKSTTVVASLQTMHWGSLWPPPDRLAASRWN